VQIQRCDAKAKSQAGLKQPATRVSNPPGLILWGTESPGSSMKSWNYQELKTKQQ